MKNEQEALIHRITGFSDAVFAVAITLLVLDIHTAELPALLSNADFSSALLNTLPKFWSFALSFFVIGRYWVSHVRFFQFFRTIQEEEKPRLLFMTLVLLFFVVLLPFSTSLISAHPEQQLAVAVYAGNIAAGGFAQYVMWLYVTREYMQKAPKQENRLLYYQSMRLLVTPLVFLLSIPLAFYNVHLAEYFWILILFVRTQIVKRQRSL